MNYLVIMLRYLANDDTIERDYLKVGWRDILLRYAKEIEEGKNDIDR